MGTNYFSAERQMAFSPLWHITGDTDIELVSRDPTQSFAVTGFLKLLRIFITSAIKVGYHYV